MQVPLKGCVGRYLDYLAVRKLEGKLFGKEVNGVHGIYTVTRGACVWIQCIS